MIFQALHLHAPPEIPGMGCGDSFRMQAHHLAGGGGILQSPKQRQVLGVR